MKRRDFLIKSGIVLGSGAFALGAWRMLSDEAAPLFEGQVIPSASQEPLLALSKYILPKETTAETAKLCLFRVEEFAQNLSPRLQSELEQVFALLSSNILLKTLTHTAKDTANESQALRMLDKWKNSFDHLLLGNDLRAGYKALTDLFYLAFYSLPQGQAIAGYER